MLFEYTRPNIYYCAGVKLLPGISTVPDELVAAFVAHPGVQARIGSGVIVPLVMPMTAEQATSPADTAGEGGRDGGGGKRQKEPTTSASQLIEEIATTYDPARLAELAADKRKSIAVAATERLKAIADVNTGGDSGGDSA